MSRKGIKIMGIVNVNDDSFFAQSRVRGRDAFARRAEQLIAEGADIIDAGAVSSRPGSTLVSEEEEWARLAPALEGWKSLATDVPLSIDTFRSGIIRRACETVGPLWINDISAGEWDEAMLPFAAEKGLPYIAMHHQGDFSTMHGEFSYGDVVEEVLAWFERFARRADAAGISDWICDPGFGFSKSIEDCLRLMEGLSRLQSLGKPILCGISNKRMTRGRDADALLLQAVKGGATILRVHDVAHTAELLSTIQ